MSGSMRSRTTTGGCCWSASDRPWVPSSAVSTSKPARRRLMATRFRMSASSSTTRTVLACSMECLRGASILVAKKQVEMPRAAVLALLLTTACARRPEDSLFYEETWEAFVLAPTGVIEVGARVSNRGLRRGLASMHARTVRPEGPMELLSEGPTTTVQVAEDHQTLHLPGGSIGNDGMGAGNWRVMGSEVSVVSFAIQNRLDAAAPHAAWLDRGGRSAVEVPIAEGHAVGTTWADNTLMSGSAVAV